MIPELCYVLPFFIVSIYLINVQPKNHELILFKTEYTGCLPDIRVCWGIIWVQDFLRPFFPRNFVNYPTNHPLC